MSAARNDPRIAALLQRSAPATRAEIGPMVTGADVEDAILATLKDWLPAYICEAERDHQMEVGSTPWPKGWAITGRDLQKLNSDQLPCLVLMAGGVLTPPRKEGPPGVYTATWGVEIGSVFNAAWGRSSRRHAQLYAAAIRTCLIQRPMPALGEVVVDPRGEVYDEMDFADSRTYSASVVSFDVEVRGMGWDSGGPPPAAAPPTDPTVPFEPWVTVTDVEIDVRNDLPPNHPD